MTPLPTGYLIRPLSGSDGPGLTEAQQRNRAHLAPWSPRRGDSFFTPQGQEAELASHLEAIAAGRLGAYLIVHGERIVGRVNLNTIVRGAFHSASLGYWVDKDELNKGLATAGVRFACDAAEELGLHRVEAGTLVHNEPSQRVLRRCGFARFGTATDYLFINGAWRDHHLYQRILNAAPLQLG